MSYKTMSRLLLVMVLLYVFTSCSKGTDNNTSIKTSIDNTHEKPKAANVDVKENNISVPELYGYWKVSEIETHEVKGLETKQISSERLQSNYFSKNGYIQFREDKRLFSYSIDEESLFVHSINRFTSDEKNRCCYKFVDEKHIEILANFIKNKYEIKFSNNTLELKCQTFTYYLTKEECPLSIYSFQNYDLFGNWKLKSFKKLHNNISKEELYHIENFSASKEISADKNGVIILYTNEGGFGLQYEENKIRIAIGEMLVNYEIYINNDGFLTLQSNGVQFVFELIKDYSKEDPLYE